MSQCTSNYTETDEKSSVASSFLLLAYKPLSKHKGRFGFSLIVGGRRAADDNGGSTVTTQRVLQNTGHLAVSVGDVSLTYREKNYSDVPHKSQLHILRIIHVARVCR